MTEGTQPLRAQRGMNTVIAVVVFALLVAAPYWGLPNYWQSLLYMVFFWVTLSTSWNLLSGYSGYFSFGHGAFFGLGMYGMATFATKLNFGFVPSVLLSGVVAAVLVLADPPLIEMLVPVGAAESTLYGPYVCVPPAFA